MAEHTKIIEFFGLPGCGKTTLCTNLKNNAEEKGYMAGLINGISKVCTIRHILSVLSLGDIPLLVKWCIIVLRNNHRINSLLIISPYKRLLIYRCIMAYSDFDYVFIEHGVVQSIVSALYGSQKPYSILESRICETLLANTKVAMFMYCEVSSETSLKRIKERNRRGYGRFDQMEEESLLTILNAQHHYFNKLLLKLEKLQLRSESINNSCGIEEVVNRARKSIGI